MSRSAAGAFGAVFVAFGMFPILIGLGIITPAPDGSSTPGWVLIAAGLFFVLGGVTVILDFAIGHGVGPDGNWAPGTPFYIRAGNFALGTGNVGLLAALFGWAAFGRGQRTFSTTTVVPFVAWHSENAGELSGRIFFGFFTILFAWAFVACAFVGVRKLVREWRAMAASSTGSAPDR